MRHAARIASAVLSLFTVLATGAASRASAPVETFREAWGPSFRAQSAKPDPARPETRKTAGVTRWVLDWNRIAIDASGIDHTPVAPGESRVFGEQLGPGRASRAIAIVHVAMFETLNAITPRYRSRYGLERPRGQLAKRAALAQAAHDTLVAMFPSQKPSFDAALAAELATVKNGVVKQHGVDLGALVAAVVLAARANDGAAHAEPVMGEGYVPGDWPGAWRQDPVSLVPIALGAHWGTVEPIVLPSGSFFRAPPPPALGSAEYAAAFDEVKRLGGDGVVTPTERTEDQTLTGIYWAYDGTPSLCAPPRLYNQITRLIADRKRTQGLELARLLALVNVAMSDAGIAIWESKFHYALWRPVHGIREADPGTGPTGEGDGNPATVGDPTFLPLGAPASNLAGPNFTPPFPAYPSGHAGFGGALFQTLRRFYRTDEIAFSFVSDELNGVTTDNEGNVRPRLPRSFATLSQAEDENGQSRIYLGIHWAFDKTEGIAQGRRVADFVFDNAWPRGR
ncbi:MAG TPA: vanadium-dependent haloperoxidase [Candidatus Binatia bacterium]